MEEQLILQSIENKHALKKKYLKYITNSKRLIDVDKVDQNFDLAEKYHEYMKFRAAKENTTYGLDVMFYLLHLLQQCSFFFGVYHNGKKLIFDIQQPTLFKEWKKNKKNSQIIKDKEEEIEEEKEDDEDKEIKKRRKLKKIKKIKQKK